MISTVAAYLLLIALLFSIPFMENYRATVLILSAEILFATLGVSWVCNIYEDFFVIAVRTIAMQIISLVLIFLLVRSPNDLYKYVFILLVSNSGANLFNFFYVRKKYCNFHFTIHIEWERRLRPILVIFSTTVAITVYVSSDTTMLGFITNDFQVGLYGTAVKIYTIIKNILAAILMVLIPQFTLLFSKRDRKSSDELFSRVFNILTVIMLPMCAGLFLLSEDIVLLISGREFFGASQPLRLLSVAVAFSLYSYMYTQCVLIPVKQEKIVFHATLISALTNIGLNFIFIPIWGMNAAAVTTIIAEFITFAISYYYSKNIVALTGIKRNLISVLTGCVGIIFVCFFTGYIANLILRVGCSVVCSIIIYLMILVGMKNPIFSYCRFQLLSRRRKKELTRRDKK